MKKHSLLTRFLFLFFIVCFSCNKTDTGSKSYTPEYVKATISGRVTDDASKPVSGATVKVGTSSATTNVDGAFTISDVTVDKTAALITVEKDGFFLGTKTLVATANKNNQAAIKLIRKILAGTVTASSGGTIIVPSNGGSIDFEANSVINPATNTAYTGTVAVHAFFINPEAPDFNEIMPGTLRGITTSNEETGLQSFGMMAVELSGSTGEKLQIAPGKTATLRFPIPASLQAEAPATIPLWSLDETTGLWKQEGSATREESEYVGEVSHFSFWNCDAPFPVLDFAGFVRNEQNVPLAGAEVVITVPPGSGTSGSISGNGFTNIDGVFTGKLPANKALQLKVYDKCRSLLVTKNIGPFTNTADLGVITVSSSPSLVTISGTVKNCFDQPVTNGFVTIKLDEMYFNVPVANGNFTTAITRCNNSPATARLTAFDATRHEEGAAVNVQVTGNTVNAGALVACGITADTYIRYTVDGVSYENLPPDTLRFAVTETQNNIITYLEGKRQGQQWEDIVIMFRGPKTPGIYTVFTADIYRGNYNALYFRTETINTHITEYGDAGGYVSGTFSGNLSDSARTKTVPITCSFRLKRS